MDIKRYINIILLSLSDKYKFNLIEVKTYQKHKKYTSLKLVIYKYIHNDIDLIEDTENIKNTVYYKTIEFKSERELLLKLKEMI